MAIGGYNLQQLINDSDANMRSKLIEFQQAMDKYQQPQVRVGNTLGTTLGDYQRGIYPGLQQAPAIQSATDVDLTFHANPSSLIYDVRAVYRNGGVVINQESGFIEYRHIQELDKSFIVDTMLADLKRGIGLQRAISNIILNGGVVAASKPQFSAEVEKAFKKLKASVTKDLAMA